MDITSRIRWSFPDSLRYWQSETDSLQSLLASLHTALAEKTTPESLCRKLAHVRFIANMSQQFIDRLFAAEESDHQAELAEHPEFAKRVNDLRHDHVLLRSELSRLLLHLDRTCAANEADCVRLFAEVSQLIQNIRNHTDREAALLQDSVEIETGGQG